MRFLLFLLLTISIAGVGFAQEQGQQVQPPKPSTKLEAFQAKTGIVIIRGFTTITPSIYGTGGYVTVDAREFRDASNPNSRITGISITVKETTGLQRENISFIDADEIESLLQGLEYISKATRDVTNLENFEAEYRTKGNFEVIVFNRYSGELSVAVSSGYIAKTSVYLTLDQLRELSRQIVEAKAKL